ncbi:MAG: hypothetical protein AMXMBFR75_00190 [Candidatus Hinthialibacteria bacterium]
MTLDVLLVYLPYTGGFMPNLGLACVRSAMAQVGYSSQIINFDYSFSHVVNEVSDPHLRHKLYNLENWVGEDKLQGLLPDINDSVESWVQHIYSVPSNALGFSVNCFNHAATAEVIRRLRLLGDDRPILMGGANCYFPESVEGISYLADAVVLGEADETIPEMMPWFMNGCHGDPPPGVLVSHSKGEQTWKIRNPPEDLDRLPLPDYGDEIWPEGWGYPDFPIEMSRSCILSCAFCDVHSRNGSFRMRSPKRLIEEILSLKQKYPSLRLHFNDSLVNGKLPYLRETCERIEAEQIDVPLVGQAIIRRDQKFEDFQAMRRAGFHTLIYGLESGSYTVLQIMNKKSGGNLSQISQCLQMTHDAGIKVVINLIVGFPGETREDLLEAADFLCENAQYIDVVASLSTMVLLPGSPVSRFPEKFGVEPTTRFGPDWQTLDGTNNYDERQLRWSILYDRLISAGVEMGTVVKRMEKPAPSPPKPRSLWQKLAGKLNPV